MFGMLKGLSGMASLYCSSAGSNYMGRTLIALSLNAFGYITHIFWWLS